MKLKEDTLKPVDRFDLEQAIMAAWGTCEDLDLIFRRFYEWHEDMSVDDLANLIIGIKELHQIRCQRVWDIFETLIRNGVIGHEPRNASPFGKADETNEGSRKRGRAG